MLGPLITATRLPASSPVFFLLSEMLEVSLENTSPPSMAFVSRNCVDPLLPITISLNSDDAVSKSKQHHVNAKSDFLTLNSVTVVLAPFLSVEALVFQCFKFIKRNTVVSLPIL